MVTNVTHHKNLKKQVSKSNDTPKYRRWLFLVTPVIGFIALLWFLIRVIPKPSRATYPCQRAAFPLASGFICWLLGLGGSVMILRRARRQFLQVRVVSAVTLFGLAVGALWVTLAATQDDPIRAATPGAPQAANDPIGEAQGIFPGRVTWVYDPNAAQYDGRGDWWSTSNTDPEAVADMMARTVQGLTGTETIIEAWDALFRYHNQRNGFGDVGYTPGEKIMIKPNHVGGGCAAGWPSPVPGNDWYRDSPAHYTTWQLIKALLEHLIEDVGVLQEDITVGDPLCYYPREFRDPCYDVYPHVNYLDYEGGPQPDSKADGWVGTDFSDVPMVWSEPNATYWKTDYIPTCYTEATYLINLANLKFHGRGAVTLCAKNHYGSFKRRAGTTEIADQGYYDLHADLPGDMGGGSGAVPGMGHYRPQVDIMAHPELGGKTVLYLIDALYGANVHLSKWNGSKDNLWRYTMPPFNGQWPSSLFASQDAVCIESVGFDFLLYEFGLQRQAKYAGQGPELDGADDYLHEAAQIGDPPSGTWYDPGFPEDCNRPTSLGVHEHWNNAMDKQYSRNLDPNDGTGIELVQLHGTKPMTQPTRPRGR